MHVMVFYLMVFFGVSLSVGADASQKQTYMCRMITPIHQEMEAIPADYEFQANSIEDAQAKMAAQNPNINPYACSLIAS